METSGEWIEVYKDIRSKVGSEAEAIAILHEHGKSLRGKRMAELGNRSTDDKASTKQLAYLKFLKVKTIPETRGEASELIDDAVQKAAM